MAELTERELAVLALEAGQWQTAGAKEQAIRAQLDISGTRYYQLLNGLLDRQEALAHDPVLINRLRRIRETKRAER